MTTSVRDSLLRSAGARAITLPVSAVFSLLTSALILRNFGTDSFSQYTLVISIAAVLPFADLGVGAATVNAVSKSSSFREESVVSVTVASLRILIFSATVLSIVAVAITMISGWKVILGDSFEESAGLYALIGVLFFAASMPLGLGQRIAIGAGKNERQVLIQGLQPALVFLAVLVATAVFNDGKTAILCFFGAYLLTTFLIAFDANRLTDGLLVRATRLIFRFDKARNIGIFQTALPMLAVMIGMPLVLQTHRMVLSHLSDAEAIAQYSLAAQMFLPVAAVVGAASVSLWPQFAKDRARDTGSRAPHPLKLSAIFAGASLILCSVGVLLAPMIAPLISGNKVDISPGLGLAFTFFVVCQSLQSPLGIYLTDISGLRYQSVCVVAVVLSAFVLCLLLTPSLGAAGPLVATGVSIFVFQVIPYSTRIVLRRRAMECK
ncbi:lipopolysaccharide biosynthesis protein [Rhodococcus sp. 077-4]|uniref:lipopolysaccharide biosynthesis protein n=1 Tax=Rhodococcus sp. 077-4 TaxID=2789271 RepID=UPI0039F45F4C